MLKVKGSYKKLIIEQFREVIEKPKANFGAHCALDHYCSRLPYRCTEKVVNRIKHNANWNMEGSKHHN